MMDKHVFKSEPEEAGIRIDIYLAAKMGNPAVLHSNL